jgi:1-acyl-sn-glycerol-3-phosphate acyltransferase
VTEEQPKVPSGRGARVGWGIAHGLIRTLWSVRTTGAEQVPATGPVILAPNHTGFLDAPLLMSSSPRPVHALAKKELFRGPLGWFLTAIGQIPLDRNDPGRDLLRSGMAVLGADRVLVVFPEGTRGAGDFREMRTGLAWFALRTGAPVVPVVFRGTAGRSRTLGGLPRLRKRLDVVFGAPVVVETAGGRTRAALDAATQTIHDALIAHHAATMSQEKQ